MTQHKLRHVNCWQLIHRDILEVSGDHRRITLMAQSSPNRENFTINCSAASGGDGVLIDTGKMILPNPYAITLKEAESRWPGITLMIQSLEETYNKLTDLVTLTF